MICICLHLCSSPLPVLPLLFFPSPPPLPICPSAGGPPPPHLPCMRAWSRSKFLPVNREFFLPLWLVSGAQTRGFSTVPRAELDWTADLVQPAALSSEISLSHSLRLSGARSCSRRDCWLITAHSQQGHRIRTR